MAYPIQKLIDDGFDVTVYFFNPNIYPQAEYLRRLQELTSYCKKMTYKFIVDDYCPDEWKNYIKGLEVEPEKGLRCNKCFEYRLEKTAQVAKELEIANFTTTLTVSPHKISKNIFFEGQKIADKYGLNFMDYDFKKQNGFLKSMELAKTNGFYRQDYCGCEYSIRS